MVQAIWNGSVIAESDDTIVVDGYTYFPRDAVNAALLEASTHTSVCGWKGQARYYHLNVDGKHNRDAAWYYPTPSRAAAKVEGRIAFWRGVKIHQAAPDRGARPAGWRDRLRLRATPDQGPPAAPTHADSDTVVVDLNDANFETGTTGHWTVVDFWAPWCGPCRAFHPIFEQVARDTTGVTFARCNADTNTETAAELDILSIPTVVLFDPDGREVDRIIGVPPGDAFTKLLIRSTATGAVPR